MIKNNNYNPQLHPTENNMNMGTQTARLFGKLNIGVKVEKEEKPEVEYGFVVIDGNSEPEDMNVFDGNFNE